MHCTAGSIKLIRCSVQSTSKRCWRMKSWRTWCGRPGMPASYAMWPHPSLGSQCCVPPRANTSANAGRYSQHHDPECKATALNERGGSMPTKLYSDLSENLDTQLCGLSVAALAGLGHHRPHAIRWDTRRAYDHSFSGHCFWAG